MHMATLEPLIWLKNALLTKLYIKNFEAFVQHISAVLIAICIPLHGCTETKTNTILHNKDNHTKYKTQSFLLEIIELLIRNITPNI